MNFLIFRLFSSELSNQTTFIMKIRNLGLKNLNFLKGKLVLEAYLGVLLLKIQSKKSTIFFEIVVSSKFLLARNSFYEIIFSSKYCSKYFFICSIFLTPLDSLCLIH